MSVQRAYRSFIGWMLLVVVPAAGGWLVGREMSASGGMFAGHPPQGRPEHGARTDSAPPFAPESPRGRWMARVKHAGAADFPGLFEEWDEVFAYDDAYEEGWPPNAVNAFRWLMGMWLAKDFDGFLKAVSAGSFDHADWAARTLVQLMPEKAAGILSSPELAELNDFLFRYATALAEQYPALYLKLDPDATLDFNPRLAFRGWEIAITNLAKTDAPAAGNACLRWKDQNNARTVYGALRAVAEAWKPGDPPIAAWADAIVDPKLRNIAKHAWLSVLAEKDPKAALAALPAAKLGDDNGLDDDAALVIARQLGKTDLPEALKLMKDMEGYFAKHPEDNDPFSEQSAGDTAEDSRNPFARFHPDHNDDEPSDNLLQFVILSEAMKSLPDDPGQLRDALRELYAGMGDGDTAWQRRVEGDLIRRMSDKWPVETCLKALGLWLEGNTPAPDDPTLRKLATRAATADPQQALAAWERFPEQARPFLAGEIIKHLPASELSENTRLFSQLNPEQWDSDLGGALGRNAENFAPIIASLPAATTLGARRTFMWGWAERDPEAAAQWLASLPADAEAAPAAEGLATGWVRYDPDAAGAWADTLPEGPVYDAAAASFVDRLAMGQSKVAWHWAATISDPATRAKAFDQVAVYWKIEAPDDFRAAHDDVRRSVGLPPYRYHDPLK